MNNLNETVEKLNVAFRAAGVKEPEHPRVHLPRGSSQWELGWWIEGDWECEAFLNDQDAYDLLASRYERLWQEVMGQSVGFWLHGDEVNLCWYDDHIEQVLEPEPCKPTAILKAMEALQNESGGE